MPTFVHGKNTRVLIDANDLSGYLNNTDVNQGAEEAETTVYTSGVKTYLAGLPDFSLSMAGMWSGGVGEIDEYLASILADSTIHNVSVAQAGLTLGNRVMLVQSTETGYTVTSPVTDVVSISADFRGSGTVRSGVSLHTLTGESATGNGTSIDNAAASTNGSIGFLHVPTNTRNGTTIVKVQHSTDNSVWVDLLTFATVSASTTASDVQTSTGTVNRYVRAQWTVAGTTGATTFVVTFART